MAPRSTPPKHCRQTPFRMTIDSAIGLLQLVRELQRLIVWCSTELCQALAQLSR
jgi:hypothetical protein